MPLHGEERKHALVENVAALAAARPGAEKKDALARLVRRFYAHVPPEDVLSRDAEDLCGAAGSLWQFAQQRKPGTVKLRILNPRRAEHGWRSNRTIIEIVNDDMPFLVDSVTAALNEIDLIVHLVIHPIVAVRRDAEGRLIEQLDGRDGNDADGA